MQKRMRKLLTATIAPDVLEALEEYAKKEDLNRSAVVELCLRAQLPTVSSELPGNIRARTKKRAWYMKYPRSRRQAYRAHYEKLGSMPHNLKIEQIDELWEAHKYLDSRTLEQERMKK